MVEYNGLEGWAQKRRAEVCMMGCILETALRKPQEQRRNMPVEVKDDAKDFFSGVA